MSGAAAGADMAARAGQPTLALATDAGVAGVCGAGGGAVDAAAKESNPITKRFRFSRLSLLGQLYYFRFYNEIGLH